MLNVLNLVTSFKERLLDQRDRILAIVEPYINAIVDDELELDLTYDNEGFEIEIPREKFMAYHNMFEAIVGSSFQLLDGTVFGINKEVITDATHLTTIYKDGVHDNAEICRLIQAIEGDYHSYFIQWKGWDVAHKSNFANKLSYFYDGLLEAESISSVVSSAIDLCAKGQLDPTNFSAIINSMGYNTRESAKQVMNMIVQNISGTAAYQQAYGLLESLQSIYSGATVTNMTVDDDRIDFHPTEYSVVAAILLPIDSVVATIASVIGTIIAMFGHPIGLILNAAGTIFSGLMSAAETTLGNDWNISTLESIDNESCCLQLAGGATPTSNVPQKIVDYTKKYGYLRSENAFYILYTWMGDPIPGDPPTEMIFYELFPNVNVNLNYDIVGTTTNSLINDIRSAINQETIGDWVFTPVSAADAKTHAQSLFTGEVNTPSTGVKVQFPTEATAAFNNFQNRFIVYNLILQFAHAAFRYMSAYYDYYSIVEHGSVDETYWYRPKTKHEADTSWWDEDQCMYHFASLIKWVSKHLDDGDFSSWMDIGETDNYWASYSEGLVNIIYKSFLKLRELGRGYQDKYIIDVFSEFDTTIDMGDSDNSRNLIGEGYVWSPCPCIKYSNDFLVSPPKNRYNFTTRLLTTAGVLLALAAATAVSAVKIKKKVAFKSMDAQRKLQSLRDAYEASGSYDDWNALYRASKKYNRTYGLLTGTSFDMNNAWYNDTRATGVMNATSDVFPNLVKADPTTGDASIDLSPVINLIK